MHRRIFPLLFNTTTIDDTQSVGVSTGLRIPWLTKRSISFFNGSLTAMGTFLTGRVTGGTDLSSRRCNFCSSLPSPEKTPGTFSDVVLVVEIFVELYASTFPLHNSFIISLLNQSFNLHSVSFIWRIVAIAKKYKKIHTIYFSYSYFHQLLKVI